jgi:hypothetical protein
VWHAQRHEKSRKNASSSPEELAIVSAGRPATYAAVVHHAEQAALAALQGAIPEAAAPDAAAAKY